MTIEQINQKIIFLASDGYEIRFLTKLDFKLQEISRRIQIFILEIQKKFKSN
jgi:hypothetical protein